MRQLPKILFLTLILFTAFGCNQKSSKTNQDKEYIAEETIQTLTEFVDEDEETLTQPPPPPPAPKRKISLKRSGRPIPPPIVGSNEEYAKIQENDFHLVQDSPLSTFSIDVDKANYATMRRFISRGQLPPESSVRIEELINYFDYDYSEEKTKHPYNLYTSLTDSPWNKGLKLAHIALQGKKLETKHLPASNLVFLIDVSGSMDSPDKLGLLKSGLNLLIEQLRPQDKISVVVYASAAGVVLKPTSGKYKEKIKAAIEELEAGGSTAGGEGIELAYKLAEKHFKKNGNNRIILATDGDFNVGVSSEKGLEQLIEQKRKSGIFLSVLGFGTGNYKDNKMELLADKGNGNYSYIDQILEAKKVLIDEFGGTLFTIAKDVKLQVEFNPKQVQAYRLVGYVNRKMKNEDFNDDKKDAGEMGAGHSVTAIYEIIPRGIKSTYLKSVDPLKYQELKETFNNHSNEILTVKTRYKKPKGTKSILFDKVLTKENYKEFEQIKQEQKFSIAVAEFGLLLSNSDFKGSASYQQVIDLAKQAKGQDLKGYRAEFIRLAETAQLLDNKTPISLKKVEKSKSKGILFSYPRTPEYPGGIKNLRNELKENINIKNCCPNSSEGIIVVRFLLKKMDGLHLLKF